MAWARRAHSTRSGRDSRGSMMSSTPNASAVRKGERSDASFVSSSAMLARVRALVLDFDGVIADSAPEAFEVALRTYAELRPDSDLLQRDRQAVWDRFLGIMPLGNRAEDYCVILLAIEERRELPDQAAYDAFHREQDRQFLRDFHRRFYRVRRAFSDAEPERWGELMRPYARFAELLRRRGRDVRLAIATAKDHRSVLALLRAWGLADLFAEEHVLDKETGVSKAAHFEHLHERLGLSYPEMTFVDDKVNHLDAVAPLGVRCALAAWGYNGAREHVLAASRGYCVCRLENVERQLFGGRGAD